VEVFCIRSASRVADGFNNRRLLGPIGYVPPAELEEQWYESQQGQAKVA
jgi:hypothetical protein